MLDAAENSDIKLFCYEGDGTRSLREEIRARRESGELADGVDIAIVIGSEGGFSLREVETARERGFVPVGLGKRILRTETAASFALACLVYELEL